MLPDIENAIKNDKITHAYVFVGVEISKNLAAADRFAKFLLCLDINNTESPDLRMVSPDDGSIGVDRIRDMRRDAYIKPLHSDRKVFIVDQADKMTTQAQNSLLKVLEEPPQNVVIILTAVSFNSLLPTIRSRVVRIDTIGTGFSIDYSQDSSGELRQKLSEMITQLPGKSLPEALNYYGLFEADKQKIDYMLDNMLILYRDFLVIKNDKTAAQLINSDKKDIIINSQYKFSVLALIKSTEIVEKTRKYIKQNANYQLAIEVMLMALQEVQGHA